jgi:hypothetical protein
MSKFVALRESGTSAISLLRGNLVATIGLPAPLCADLNLR